jgi:hypothetical protein
LNAIESQLATLDLVKRRIEGITGAFLGSRFEDYVGFGSFSPGVWAERQHAVARLIQSIDSILSGFAPQAILRSGEDNLKAFTIVKHSGEIVTVWCEDAGSNLIDSHLATVQGAIEHRLALVQLVVTIGKALSSISGAIANPLTGLAVVNAVDELKQALEKVTATALETAQCQTVL